MSKREEKIRMSLHRLADYDRAHLAGKLVENDAFYAATQNAVQGKDKGLFLKTCKEAGIPDDLATRMWKIVDAAWETVYSKENPGPIW